LFSEQSCGWEKETDSLRSQISLILPAGAATAFAPAAAPGVAIAAADVSNTALAPASAPVLERAVAAVMDEVPPI